MIANSYLADYGDSSLWYDGTPCWLWIGCRASNGYGLMGVRMKRGPRKGKAVQKLAHRMSLAVFRDRVISGRKVVKHLCNNKACINPMHLVGGTQRSNMRQCVRQGRHWSGFRGPKPTAVEALMEDDHV